MFNQYSKAKNDSQTYEAHAYKLEYFGFHDIKLGNV